VFTPHIIFFFFGSTDTPTTEVGMGFTTFKRMEFTALEGRLHWNKLKRLHWTKEDNQLHWTVTKKMNWNNRDD
jgi:hypothetical protein